MKSTSASAFCQDAALVVASMKGYGFMLSDDELHTILRNIRLIQAHCFDLTTFGRLRLLADQIEQKMRRPSVALTEIDVTQNQDGNRTA
jgi:hypothetical protein